jgi:hypothetical protein
MLHVVLPLAFVEWVYADAAHGSSLSAHSLP